MKTNLGKQKIYIVQKWLSGGGWCDVKIFRKEEKALATELYDSLIAQNIWARVLTKFKTL